MKRAGRIILLAVMVAGGCWLWRHFHPTPQEAIRRRIAEVAAAVSYTEPGGLIAQAVKAQKLAGYFAPEVTILIQVAGQSDYELASRGEIQRNALALRSRFHSLKVQLLDPNVLLGADQQSAIVDLTLRAETAGDEYLAVQEMKFTLRQVEGEWLIVRIETVKTLNRAPTPHARETPACA